MKRQLSLEQRRGLFKKARSPVRSLFGGARSSKAANCLMRPVRARPLLPRGAYMAIREHECSWIVLEESHRCAENAAGGFFQQA